MRWDLLKTELPEALAMATGLREPDGTTPSVYWKGRATEYRPDVFALIEVLNMASPWPDETRLPYDSEADTITEIGVGVREVTLQVTLESMSQEPDKTALAWASLMRTRIWSSDVRHHLRDEAGAVLLRATPAISAPYLSREDRQHSAALFELTLRAHDVYAGPTHDPVERFGVSVMGGAEQSMPPEDP